MELSENDFKRLWELNPSYNQPDHSYENTYNYLDSYLRNFEDLTHDGKIADFDLIYDRYKAHIHTKTLLNEGVEERFIKKENRIKPLFVYISEKMFMSEEKLPNNNRHFYFWGNMPDDDIVKKHTAFLKLWKEKVKSRS